MLQATICVETHFIILIHSCCFKKRKLVFLFTFVRPMNFTVIFNLIYRENVSVHLAFLLKASQVSSRIEGSNPCCYLELKVGCCDCDLVCRCSLTQMHDHPPQLKKSPCQTVVFGPKKSSTCRTLGIWWSRGVACNLKVIGLNPREAILPDVFQ